MTMRGVSKVCVALLLSGAAFLADAHPLAPALLEIQEQAPGQYRVLWRVSLVRAPGEDLSPVLPADCDTVVAPATRVEQGQSLATRWTVQCGAGGLVGETLRIAGIEHSSTRVILRIQDKDGAVSRTLLGADHPEYRVPGPGMASPVFGGYLWLGIGHLLTGLDHVLFLLGLLLLVWRPRDADAVAGRLRVLLITVTAFTLGHSITLSLASLGFILVRQAYTELAIAGTILVLACQLARPAEHDLTLFMRKPWLMAFSFGLLHGLGFAGALADIGLPQDEIPLSLFAFNVGIEVGQVALISAVLAMALAWRRLSRFVPTGTWALARAVPAYVIGSLAVLWCLERVATLFDVV